ncbi:peptide ABC transporter permease [Mesorhizobium sp. L-8-10]|uniref:ABC transporter permease n=1 Tax=Mesorhizobium sp. L-8-10 TaxID=2744523 RepID=UPI001925B877|nr:ABC transporter permease [Mesorhizobium sp. L-8-10]BCH31176.1 peptide ABC transporter permease [Mesorhizobium sp. L-8-10]
MGSSVLLRRLMLVVPVLFGMSVVSFLLIHLVPGDVVTVIAGAEIAPDSEEAQNIRRSLNLDRPLVTQYLLWILGVAQGDLGLSLISKVPVSKEILSHLPVTLVLTVMALGISVLIGIPAGVLAASRRGRISDFLLRIASLAGMAVPTFFASVTAVLFFSLFAPAVRLFNTIDFGRDAVGAVATLFLPACVLALSSASTIMRYTRGAMLEVMREQYIQTARAKGAGPMRILLRHGLRTALLPVVTASGLIAAQLISGVVVVEQVFGLPGMGQLMLSAISTRDYTLVQGTVLAVGAMVVLINLVVDLTYHFLDPRI